jgi:uncharacterized repeat protein (TIGR01451 family)
MPDGTFARFRVVESPIMEPELAAKFPQLKTYTGQGIDDATATVRFDSTPSGVHGLVISSKGSVFIDPLAPADPELHVSVRREDLAAEFRSFGCATSMPDRAPAAPPPMFEAAAANPLVLLRTFRLAVAAQGEYTQFHGGTVAGAMAAIVTTVNRVNSVYERDLAIRFVLVANNDRIIYTDPLIDPYARTNATFLLDPNQANLDAVIGSANYDVGHLVNRNSGGVAFVGSACVAGIKAHGVSGLPYPAGPSFDIDYFGHELGHQFNALHTWNGTNGFCAPDQYSAEAAYETGSGSTIMAYTANCGSDDVQNIGSPFFHSISYDEITAYTTTGAGSACPTRTSTDNTAPVVNAGPNYTIPMGTPFTLTATGSDPDGDLLTYTWEERDLGPQQPLTGPSSADNGRSPLFRWVVPTTNASRTFPKLEALLNNTPSHGEQLPSTQRLLHFRVTARDNRSGGGGVRFAEMQLSVVTNAGPFVVTSPNSAVTWTGTQRVTWNVADTTNASIRATHVNILLSLDGGYTFPVTLAANTPNDGEEIVALPDVATTLARIKVEAVGNVFFDISDTNFTLAGPIVIAGTVLQSEGCVPANRAPDPGETVTVSVTLQNISPIERTNLAVELLSTNGVLAPSDPQSIGSLPAGATITNTFTFTVAPTVVCGATVNAILRLRDQTGDLGTISFQLGIGQTTVAAFSAANPAVIRPALWSLNSPYPSAIGISNVPGVASKVTVTLSNMTEFIPDAVDIVLVNPAGQSVLLMSDYPYGYGFEAMPTASLTFDADAPVSLRDVYPITSGTYRTTDYDYFPGVLPPPAPPVPPAGTLSALRDSNPNGTWKLFVADHFAANFAPTNALFTNSRIAGGWSLAIYTSNTVCCAGSDLLALAMVDSGDPVTVGQPLTYTLAVTNRGSSTVTDVTLSDQLPPDVANVSFTTSQGACSQIGDVITCHLGSLGPGATAQVSVGVTPLTPGTITNSATVSAAEPDGNPANNSATTLTTIDPALALSISDSTIGEGDTGFTNAIFRVLLPVVSSVPITVSFTTSDGTATAGSDYVATSGTLTFAPGEIVKIIFVPVLGDTQPEPNETFLVTLFDPVNAVLSRAAGTGTIRNDDAVISIGDVTQAEGNVGTRLMRFPVTLSAPELTTVSVRFVTSNGTATAGSDYAPQAGLVAIPPGSLAAEVAVAIVGDTSIESDKTFFVTLFSPTNAPLGAKFQGIGTILNDDGRPGSVDHFVWSAMAPTQYVGLDFSGTITAMDAVNQRASSFSGAVSLAALGPDQDVTIGTNLSTWAFPIQAVNYDTRLQSILLAGEIGATGRVTGLALDVTALPGQTLNNWTIRLKHTTQTNYPVGAWQGDGWTVVHQTNLSLIATGWVTLPFSTPFDYNGTNHLMVDFSFHNPSNSTSGQCRYRNVTAPARSLYGQANGTLGDPLAWSGTNTPAPLFATRIPNLRLTVNSAVPVAPLFSSSFAGGVWNGVMLVPGVASNLVLRADDGDGHIGISHVFVVALPADSDGDGLPDPWEMRYFGALDTADGAPDADPDGDGLSNRDEFLAGTNPMDPESGLRITRIEMSATDVHVRFRTALGRRYQLEYTAQLGAADWSSVAAPLSGNGSEMEALHPGGVTQGQRFYRVRLLP